MQNNKNIRINDILEELYTLREENQELKVNNDFLQRKMEFKDRMINGLKHNLHKTTDERNRLCDKCNAQSKELQDIKQLSMFEFGNLYCSNESLEADGHAFARSLLGKPATPADIAEETAIANGEKHYTIFNGDDY